MSTPSTPRGRPRDPAIDAAVLDATRQLLTEVGYARTTVQEVSRRCGVHPPGIYRRWPSRTALIEDAAFGDLADVTVDPTGNLRADLQRFVDAYEASLDTPPARAAIPGLLANYRGAGTGETGEVAAEPPADRWVHLSVRPQFAAILAASDETDPGLDPDEAFEIVLSLVLARLILPPLAHARRPTARVAETVFRAIRRPDPT